MLAWIDQHFQALSLLVSLTTVGVWIAYLQVYVSAYRRQRRFKIMINRSHGRGLSTLCLVSNMSTESIYVQSLVATLEGENEKWECPLTDLTTIEETNTAAVAAAEMPTRQGPLAAGNVRNMGSFRSLIDHVLKHNPTNPLEPTDEVYQTLRSFEVTVLGVYASEDLMVGAKRMFDLVRINGRLELQARNVTADQIRNRRERRALTQLLEREL